MKPLLVILLALFSHSALAEAWRCTNDLEITCHKGKCTQNKDFTPLSVNFDDSGSLSACAYSGCWEGVGSVTRQKGFLLLHADRLTFMPVDATREKTNIAIALDLQDKVAVIKAGGFSLPLHCNQRED